MKNALRRLIRAALLAVAVFGAQHACAQIAVSNLSGAYHTNWIVAPSNLIAGSFTTDASQPSYTLASISVQLGPGVGAPSGFTARLFTDNAGLPGTALETLSGNSTPAGNATYSYTSGGTTLSANTTYWFVASASSGNANTDYYHVAMTNTLSETNTGGASWTIGDGSLYSLNNGTSWSSFGDAPMFSVTTAATVPEPAMSAVLLGCGVLASAYRWRRRVRVAS